MRGAILVLARVIEADLTAVTKARDDVKDADFLWPSRLGVSVLGLGCSVSDPSTVQRSRRAAGFFSRRLLRRLRVLTHLLKGAAFSLESVAEEPSSVLPSAGTSFCDGCSGHGMSNAMPYAFKASGTSIGQLIESVSEIVSSRIVEAAS